MHSAKHKTVIAGSYLVLFICGQLESGILCTLCTKYKSFLPLSDTLLSM